jgi:hypothetical protein
MVNLSKEQDGSLSVPQSIAEQSAVQLRQLFLRNGYVRLPSKKRIRREGCQKYKKGYEVRLVLKQGELLQVRRLLKQLGFRPGKKFLKNRRVIQPVYGRSTVEWFAPKKLN